ncbi:phytoene/squalene synthase family protein [Nocardia noduli]|uniref:phytoene/squalene synthase family protein n=1 Tax=Nocardia noduli TaxID=2815722 RepID=UPI001C2463C5|nr:phytoene/squalene synthase family protein [Nocardia noduli]
MTAALASGATIGGSSGAASALADAYELCGRIAAEHGRTYHLATRLLGPSRRSAVHALYAFARVVDDIVDVENGSGGAISGDRRARSGVDPEAAADATEQLDSIERQLWASIERHGPAIGRTGIRTRTGDGAKTAGAGAAPSTSQAPPPTSPQTRPELPGADAYRDQVLLAVTDTIRRYDIAPAHFRVFLASMRMDIPGTSQFRDHYPTMDDLREYMRGSAAAIGLQLLPVLGTVVPVEAAEPAAAALGEAFQLTNFLRDVAEDLDRGRLYLPADELAAFGVDRALLAHCRDTGRTDPRVRRALSHLIAINRDIYRRANPGIDLLDPRVRPAIRTASTLYAGILDRVESGGYDIFRTRAAVPRRVRLRVAAAEFAASAVRDRLRTARRPLA